MHAVGVTGSRYGHRWVRPTLALRHKKQPITHLILGCAKGVDRQALEWALDNNVFFVVFTADWYGLGKRAGFLRNQQMVALGVEYGADWVGFPVGESRGTHHCMDEAASCYLEVWRVDSETGVVEGWF